MISKPSRDMIPFSLLSAEVAGFLFLSWADIVAHGTKSRVSSDAHRHRGTKSLIALVIILGKSNITRSDLKHKDRPKRRLSSMKDSSHSLMLSTINRNPFMFLTMLAQGTATAACDHHGITGSTSFRLRFLFLGCEFCCIQFSLRRGNATQIHSLRKQIQHSNARMAPTCFDLAIWSIIDTKKKIIRPARDAFHRFSKDKMLPVPGSREASVNLPSSRWTAVAGRR